MLAVPPLVCCSPCNVSKIDDCNLGPRGPSRIHAVHVHVYDRGSSLFRWLLAVAAGGGPTVLSSFFLTEAFLLLSDKLGEGGPAGLFVLECLVLTQMFKEQHCLDDNQISSQPIKGKRLNSHLVWQVDIRRFR